MGDFVFRLRECRTAAKMSQGEMAKQLNISRQAYSTYETGTRKPDIDTLRQIADIFRVTTDYLLGRDKAERGAQNNVVPKTVAAHTDEPMTPELEARIQELIQEAFEKYVNK